MKPYDDRGNGSIGHADGLLCTSCSTINPPQARFCTNCGCSLGPIEQMSAIQFPEGSSFSPDDASIGIIAEASTAPLLPSPDNEEAAPLTGKQEATSSIPPASSPNGGGAAPMVRNRLEGDNHGGRRRRIRSRRFITFALIAIMILLAGVILPFLVPYLHNHLAASSATVTLTPANRNFSKTYAISAVTGTPDASQVQARLLSATMKKSQTVPATGQGSEGATEATGTLIFSNSTGSFTIFAQTLADNSGVGLAIDSSFNIYPGQTLAIYAHAAQAGTIGNVSVDDINATLNLLQSGTKIGTVHVENTRPFSGGTDRTYSFVQQSDIDSAVASLQDQLTSDAQTAVQNQVRANEQFVEAYNQPVNAIQCSSPKISSNHQANDRATDVTVTVSVTCQGEVYDLQATQAMAADLLKSDAAAQLGAGYALVGNVVTGVPTILTTDQGGTVSMNAKARGVWVFQFGDSQKQNLAKLIAGKTQADASGLLLKQPGIVKINIITSGGWGTAIPAAEKIKIVVLSVPGL